jgi:2-polyprenyl-3-methyl-5-hydroxy-6-metoxy-1,4-benzoquinol methylase
MSPSPPVAAPSAAIAAAVAPPKNPLGSAEAWDMVAEAYAAELIPMFEMFSAEALKLAGVTSGMKIVDVATGPGTLALMAAAKGAKVTALDFSPAMIQQLQFL